MVHGGKERFVALVLVALLFLAAAVFIISSGQESAPSAEGPPSFIVYHEDGNISSKNITTGQVMYSSTDSSEVIQWTISNAPRGGKVLVSSGEYHLSRHIDLYDDVHLEGEGPGTIFHGEGHLSFLIEERSSVTLGNFTLLGNGSVMIAGYDEPARDILVKDITATISPEHEGAFYTLAINTVVSNVTFLRCTARDCGTNGFINNGMQLEDGWIENITYVQCKAINSGASERYNDWVVGFDLAERVHIRNMLVTECEASGSWQSGFHFELTATVENAVLMDCVANDNGRSQGSPAGEGYGWGYLIFREGPRHDIRLHGCRAEGNWRGDTNLGPLAMVQG